MASLFRNALHQDFGTWPLAYIPYGGADFGEVRAVAEAISDGDDATHHDAWTAAGDRLKAAADTALAKSFRSETIAVSRFRSAGQRMMHTVWAIRPDSHAPDRL